MGLMDGFDPERVIKTALGSGGEFGDIYVEDVTSTSISLEEGRIERVVSGRDMGCGVRVVAGLKTFYAYTSEVTGPSLIRAAGSVAAAVREGSPAGDVEISGRSVAPGFEIRRSPFDEEIAAKTAMAASADAAARGVDKRVAQVKVVYRDALKRVAVVNSLGDWVEEDKTSVLFMVQAVATDGEVIQTGYEPVGGLAGLEIFDDSPPEEIAQRAAGRAVMMLSARKAPAGAMPVVLSSEAGGTMIHEAVGHGLEADLAGEGLSVYSGRLGERVASPLVTVIDDGTVPGKRGSGFFDGEATPTQKTVLVEEGVLKGYMYDRLTAMKDGTSSTGNGRRESYKHRPIPRMTNTMIAPGRTDPDEILRTLDKGLLVKKMGGGQVNTVNGDFVFEVTEGYLVEKGKTGEAVRGATLTGNGPRVLETIDMVGSDLGFAIGTCGKDGQGAPVSDAQPTLRIPEIIVGGVVEG